ncbi:hypothetical protein MKW98_026294 [Papaver atlanticum]|uniref:BHLH domain-containing protein n=1 Tax=Papaver atlanticum TaxID=357466 RepID=A0AAD4XSF0_9MAGN|nr:hypothetical protein MKW98_026294 [Papaver atlanticum]
MDNSTTKTVDTISSWLDLDDPNLIPQELQQLLDLQMVDTNATGTSTNMECEHPYSECNLPLNLSRPDSPFLPDLHEFDNIIVSTPEEHYYHPILPGNDQVILDQQVDEEANCDKYLNVMAESTPESVDVDQYFQTDSDKLITIASISPSLVSDHVPQQLPLKKKKSPNIKKPTKVSTKRHNRSTTTATNSSVADDEDEMEEEIDGEPKSGTVSCKNLVSERNRRKRLSQKLLDLRALVPNITKMDKRSILVDAIFYLKNMQEETTKIEKELKEKQLLQNHQPRILVINDIMEGDEDDHEHDLSDDTRARTSVPGTASKPKPQIVEIDIEKMEEKRFIVKITCNGAKGVAGDIFRVMETIGFEISYAALEQIKPQQVLSTVIIKNRKRPGHDASVQRARLGFSLSDILMLSFVFGTSVNTLISKTLSKSCGTALILLSLISA